jgi:hypothetical protein
MAFKILNFLFMLFCGYPAGEGSKVSALMSFGV